MLIFPQADTEHGGGTTGHKAVQDAIDVGHYMSRMVKKKNADGKMIDLEEVAVTSEILTDEHKSGVKNKIRAGGGSAQEEFTEKVVTMLAGTDKQASSKAGTRPASWRKPRRGSPAR